MKFKLRHKITGLVLVSTLLPVIAMLLLLWNMRGEALSSMGDELDSLSRQNTRQIALDIEQMCQITHDLTMGKLDLALQDGREMLAEHRPVRLDQAAPVDWKAKNQSSGETIRTSLPRLVLGELIIEKNSQFDTPTPIVDEVRRQTGATSTIFQRMNPAGDMLRVATNVRTPQDTRAIGTYIPATEPDGQSNEVVDSILAGREYRGFALVTGIPFVSVYEPLRDADGEIVGMFFVGIPLDSIDELRRQIMTTRVGKAGYVAILDTSGKDRGSYVISKDGQRDGENIWQARDSQGHPFVQEMIRLGGQLQAGQVGHVRYPWKNPDEPQTRWKVAAVRPFEPWDWLIVAGMYEDEYHAARNEFASATNALAFQAGLAGLLVLLIVVVGAIWLARRIVRPIGQITLVAQAVARGDLQAADEMIRSNAGNRAEDETGDLCRAISQMTSSLNALVGKVKQSSVRLLSTATQIAATSKQQEGTLSELGSSTTEIAASVKQITATSKDLVQTMGQVNEAATEAGQLADAGQGNLQEMQQQMRQLGGATESISGRLATINDKANNINSIVTTINKVADQTNLLSLNAAIEAEKAGEHGLGFSVVSREIRRLADQTAVATLDIEQMVQEMTSAVSGGVMEMETFSKAMDASIQRLEELMDHMRRIIDRVGELPPAFATVEEGMQSTSAGAGQINEAMGQLTQGTRETLDSLREFNQATDAMRQAVRDLGDEIARFRVEQGSAPSAEPKE